nr:transposase [Enterobacter mori]
MDIKHGVWRDIFFKKQAVEEIWRGSVIRLLRHSYDLINPGSLLGLGHICDQKQWLRYLQAQYGRHRKVHFAKKTRGAWRSVKYLDRYLKRPQVSAAKLRHYSGGAMVHNYYDHRSQQYRQQALTQEEMIGRYISHVPAKHFKMVRYYGFLSNRKRGSLLPLVYEALNMGEEKTGAAGLRRADEKVSAHGSVQMHPVWQQATFQQCAGQQTRH